MKAKITHFEILEYRNALNNSIWLVQGNYLVNGNSRIHKDSYIINSSNLRVHKVRVWVSNRRTINYSKESIVLTEGQNFENNNFNLHLQTRVNYLIHRINSINVSYQVNGRKILHFSFFTPDNTNISIGIPELSQVTNNSTLLYITSKAPMKKEEKAAKNSLAKTPFDSIEEKILSENKDKEIRFSNLRKTGRKDKTVKEFLQRFFTELNLEKDTIYVKNKELQTQRGRRRSIGDIFMICRYYYPKCTLKEVYEILLVDFRKEYERSYRMSYCSQTRKYMFYYSEGQASGEFNTGDKNEYGYSVNDLRKLLQV